MSEKIKITLAIIGLSILGLCFLYYIIALIYMVIIDPLIHEVKVKLGFKEKGSFKERNPANILPSGFVKFWAEFFSFFD